MHAMLRKGEIAETLLDATRSQRCISGALQNPFAEVMSICSSAADRRRNWRRNVLARARSMLVEGDAGAFSLRRLADACGTSSQNIYNNIGAKADLIQASLLDYNRIVLEYASQRGPDNLYVSLLSAWCKCAEAYPEYVRAAERIIFSEPEVYRKTYRQCARDYVPFIQSIMEKGTSSPERTMLICYQLAVIGNNAIREWSEGMCTLDESYNNAMVGGELYLTGTSVKYGGRAELAERRSREI